MEVYIKGISSISPQNTLDTTQFLDNAVEMKGDYYKCIEPGYKEFISPNMARRMGRVIKMGVASALICLKDSGIEMPDAIITGTGLGCIEDTEKFMSSIINNEEKFLNPTPFIQSTHNTISAQIALLLKCKNYNYTYVHRGFSFESALIDSIMLINEGNASNILLGGLDEISQKSFHIIKRLGHCKREKISSLKLQESNTKGFIAGEASSFFVLSADKSESDYAKIIAVSTLYKPENNNEVQNHLQRFLSSNNINANDIDVIITGINGDKNDDVVYYDVINTLNNSVPAYYKHLCGEFHTSSAFALWLGARIIKEQKLPEIVKINGNSPKKIKNILIYNHYRNTNHSFMLLQQSI